MSQTAWIAGASGLVGGAALDRLLSDDRFGTVVSFGRRPSGRTHAKLVERVVDFAAFEAGDAPAPDVAVCALGTTIARAGSKEAFRAVDHDAVLAFARGAHAAGAHAFVVVTSHGADATSSMFYMRVKGEVEQALQAVGFTSLTIARPTLLIGDRTESRPGERFAIVTFRLLRPLLFAFRSRPIDASVVGAAVATLAARAEPGVHAIHTGDLHALGRPED